MKWRRQARADLTALADRLTVPRPFDLTEFCRRIADQRGRPLHLVPVANPGEVDLPCGLWLGTDRADLVFYDAAAEPILKTQIVLHEISHMLLGHLTPDVGLLTTASDAAGTPADAPAETTAPAHDPKAALAVAADRVADRELGLATDQELGLATDRVLALLARDGYSSRQESEAEALATLILERVTRATAPHPDARDSADVLARLDDAFGHPVRSS
ncbi:hypothetical protein ACIGXM_05390 [Kitasatospora sp. NPDC052896]|uniref:hypothetical protein n=1 Tax=Kitasatospora sp. NPDC052896 TaxID=3364061 RepID=UPI0037C53730